MEYGDEIEMTLFNFKKAFLFVCNPDSSEIHQFGNGRDLLKVSRNSPYKSDICKKHRNVANRIRLNNSWILYFYSK